MNIGYEGRIEIIDDLSSEKSSAWYKYVSIAENSSIYHQYAWLDLIARVFGHGSYYMCAMNAAGQIIAVLPLIHMKSRFFGNFLVSIPYFDYGGSIALNLDDNKNLHSRAIEIARSVSATHIEFRDIDSNLYPGLGIRVDKVSKRLQLPSNSDQLWPSFNSKLRFQIRRPQQENPAIRHGGKELIGDFYRVFSRNMRHLGTPVYSKVFFNSIFEYFQGHCYIVVIYYQNLSVAAGFLIGYKGMLEISWASSLKEFNKMNFIMLMYWEALKLSISNSCQIFDFGRSSVDSGTYRFKKQWGAKPVQLYWHYWLKDGGEVPMLHPSNPKYKLAIDMWQKLPLHIANYLGPMIVKNLP